LREEVFFGQVKFWSGPKRKKPPVFGSGGGKKKD
jgi:hypothetical protein